MKKPSIKRANFEPAISDAIELERQTLDMAKIKMITPIADRPDDKQHLIETNLCRNAIVTLRDTHEYSYAMLGRKNVREVGPEEELSTYQRAIATAAITGITFDQRVNNYCHEAEPNIVASLDPELVATRQRAPAVIVKDGEPVGFHKNHGMRTTYFIEGVDIDTPKGQVHIPKDSIAQVRFPEGPINDWFEDKRMPYQAYELNEDSVQSAKFLRLSNFGVTTTLKDAVSQYINNFSRSKASLRSGAKLFTDSSPESVAARVRDIYEQIA